MEQATNSGTETDTTKLITELVNAPQAARMADGTGTPGDDARAQCARTSLQTMSSRGEPAWRDIVWTQLANAFAEKDPARLHAALAQVVEAANRWIDSLTQRISTADQPTPTTATSPDELTTADLAQALDDAREESGYALDLSPGCAEAMAERLLERLLVCRRPSIPATADDGPA
ncbi:hypothetical protein OIC43_36950 [Streptomyces sp. NBC_00825]|uniref:hypothetical protein n=1 Tax=unclassified Streptomyces TaxID=2593676 RepID=UPI002ED1AC08|nr:hypothetical protein OG832_06740 [Streptomyces sp. NBC_00826]WTH94227.1 hypothetical protein OIC43_36950 [Streptomyces sp. NBC_00825]WTI02962.1 hypothetical protein OHA23_36930 [Streptomyces sp. NBC_00822]